MKCAAVVLFLLPAALMAQDANSSNFHIHGVGRLELTFTENEFALALEVPGADIVGFEHAAENEDDRSHVADAISDLSKPLTLFELPPEAGCVTASANVVLVGDAFGQADTSDNGAAEHNEFHADYVMQCEEMAALTKIRFAFFERFTEARHLSVQLTSPEGTLDVLVERETPVLTLPK